MVILDFSHAFFGSHPYYLVCFFPAPPPSLHNPQPWAKYHDPPSPPPPPPPKKP